MAMKETRAALSCIKKNDDVFFLIPRGKKILLPLSRNDHSLFLYECLKRYSMYAKKDFEIVPVCFCFESSDKPIEGYPVLYHLEVEQEKIARELASRRYESYVAKLKRLAYANEAEAHGCSLIALPTSFEDFYFHYQDNLFRQGKISAFSPYSPAANGLCFIRPFLSFSEKDMKEGEEELGIEAKGEVRDCPIGKKEKDAFLKATCYGEVRPNLPVVKKREVLEDCPDFYFAREGETMLVKNQDASEVASFRISELDAHRVRLSSFHFEKSANRVKILSSFLSYWKSKRKSPIQLCIPATEKLKLDDAWKTVGDCFTMKIW